MTGAALFSEIDSYIPKQRLAVPEEIKAFRDLKKDGKIKKEDENEFWRHPFAQKFLDSGNHKDPGKWQIELYNRDCFIRVWELSKQPREESELNEILKKLDLFKKHIEDYQKSEEIFLALKIDFSKYPFKSLQQESLDAINKQFLD